MSVPFFQRLAGIVGSFFQIGGPSGPGLNANGTALETKDSTNTTYANMRGADPVINNDLVTLRYLNAHAAQTTTRVYGVPSLVTNTIGGPLQYSQFPFDPSIYPATGRTINFKIVFFVSSGSVTATVKLWNRTDALLVTTVTTSNTTPTPSYQTVVLNVPADLPNSEKQYGVTLEWSGGTPADSASIDNCYLEVFY